MKILALDTSGPVAGCAILDGDTLLAEYTVNYKKKHSQTLLPMLDAISNMTELDISSVDAIAVAAGPGSFTGLRIGSATAKGIGLAIDKPIIEVPTLDALAYNLFSASGIICPVMDARRMQVYNGLYRFENGKMQTLAEGRALGIEELISELNEDGAASSSEDTGTSSEDTGTKKWYETYDIDAKEPVIFLGDGVPVCRDKIKALLRRPYIFAPANSNRQRAASVGALGMVLYSEGKATVKACDHVPVYLRKSQAERERDKTGLLHGDTPHKDIREKLQHINT